MPYYAMCTPDRWGLRYSDEDKEHRDQLMYPVARDYAKAMLNVLTVRVQWGNMYFGPSGNVPTLRLQWPLDKNDQMDRLNDLIRPIITTALTSPTAGFGIPPEAVPTNMGLYMPPPSRSGEQGTFSPNDWSLNLNAALLEPMFRIKAPAPVSVVAERNDQLEPVRTFADTLYHEARHCQQWFWMYALVLQHPDNFEATPSIAQWPAALATNSVATSDQASAMVALAAKVPVPVEPTALVSLKRMAVGEYLYTLNVWRNAKSYPPFAADAAKLEVEFQRARAMAIDLLQHVGIGGTPIDVDAMVAEPRRCYCDYTARPWENDAFFCGDMATAYWKAALGLALKTYAADQCSRAYEHAYADQKLASRLPGNSSSGAGESGTGRSQ